MSTCSNLIFPLECCDMDSFPVADSREIMEPSTCVFRISYTMYTIVLGFFLAILNFLSFLKIGGDEGIELQF